ncbi:CIC11C00000006057 [Sungouiella intermedia]|uniref:CIC11C00000006057 n=1 Tax=Sungouiella intermedia TaxID=45354 RepID=A0A1L0D9L9_9ASCO|nr:CIC11C00000006057 [[Candida] intermedia]
MKKIKNIIKSILLVYYLALVVLTIPLAFDVGGVQCGLTYSFALLTIYFCLTTLKLLARKYPVLRVVSLIYYSQHLFIPSILMFFLSYCSQKDMGMPAVISVWRFLLVHLTSVFTIAEGFCSLLLIQAASQTLDWLQTYKSDSWLFVSLIGSGCTFSGALYFLYRIYINPFSIELGNASLIGSFLTVVIGLGLYGIVSGKGSMIESSLLFAYIVRCIYETFPLLSEDATQTIAHLFTQTTTNLKNEVLRLPFPVNETLLTVLPYLASNLPHSFKTIWDFFISACQKLTMLLLVNLAYRSGVFFAATKIIPNLYHALPYLPPRTPQLRSRQVSSSSVSTLHMEYEKPTSDNKRASARLRRTKRTPPSTTLKLIYAYSPCIVIAVYTHLMLLYSGELGNELVLWGWWNGAPKDSIVVVHPWQFWNWINMGTTLLLYMAELSGEPSSAMTSHWHID